MIPAVTYIRSARRRDPSERVIRIVSTQRIIVVYETLHCLRGELASRCHCHCAHFHSSLTKRRQRRRISSSQPFYSVYQNVKDPPILVMMVHGILKEVDITLYATARRIFEMSPHRLVKSKMLISPSEKDR